MKILVTGALGNVGLSTVKALIQGGLPVRIFDVKSPANLRKAARLKKKVEVSWGNLCNIADVGEAVKGCDTVIHLAAIIPPLADKRPGFAEYINVEGTVNIIRAMRKYNPNGRLIFTSSIAVYGDRVKTPYILQADSPSPNAEDHYARQKLQCEKLVQESGLDWCIFRLTYIVSPHKLQLDPLMFDMPLDTSLEICNSCDTGKALAEAVTCREISGRILHLAGGKKCRTTYREYLEKMLQLFGMGKGFLPEQAFSKDKFHCGFMDTTESEQYLHYQRHTLVDYFREVFRKFRVKRFFISLVRPLARKYLLSKSPYLRHSTQQRPIPFGMTAWLKNNHS